MRGNNRKLNKLWITLVTAFIFSIFQTQAVFALTAGEEYTVKMYKFQSDGTLSLVSSTTATADANGKLSFDLSNVPNNSSAKFLYFTLEDSSSNIERKGFAPAPPENAQNLLGLTSLSTSQAAAMVKAGEIAGTDDPIMVAYGLILTRSPGISDEDIERIVTVGNAAIRGADGDSENAGLGVGDGFIGFLTSNGITDAQIDTLRSKLVYNDADGAKDLRTFTSKFKDAVDNDDEGEMSKAGGLMGEIFMDAGYAADIDPALIMAAHDAAGEVTEVAEYAAIFQAMTSSVASGIEQSVSSFFTRIAAAKIETEFTNALSALNTPDDQITTYNTAVQTMITAFEAIDSLYTDYFMDPDGYVSDNSTTHDAVQTALGTAFNAAFETFQTNVASSDDYITTMKTNFADAMGITVGDLPNDFGTIRDFTGDTVNWPIPQAAMVIWLASVIDAGGTLTYTRWSDGDLPVPGNMGWLNGDGSKTDFNTGDASFDALQGLQEDVMLIEHTRYNAFEQNNNMTRAQEKANNLAFQQKIESTIGKIGGTVDGSEAITDSQKEAIVKLLLQPSLH